MNLLAYYSRGDIQEAILEMAKDREVGVMFANGGFGKRPDVLQFKGDILEMARQGATSFHMSEERWEDPLGINTEMSDRQREELMAGWDFILDIDTGVWDYAKLTAYLLVEALRFSEVRSMSVKFSGNKGWHIAVPFESFPTEVNNTPIKNFFPEAPRIIAAYLQEMIRDQLVAMILEKDSMDEVCKKAGKKEEEIIKEGKFDPFAIVDIDTVLIAKRHLFRSAYSLHEKSGLVSLPVRPDGIMGFEKEMARPENVKTGIKFLDRDSAKKGEAKQLIIQAFDWATKKRGRDEVKEAVEARKEFQLPSVAIREELFPPCIQKILAGNLKDGRKRSLFILLNFLRRMGWDKDSIKKKINEWNRKSEPLRKGYVQSQLSWHFRQKEMKPPPSCGNKMYYQDLRLCDGKQFCLKFKNPINFAVRMARLSARKGKGKSE